MTERNVNQGEKVLVLGAGQLGAAVLDFLIPAVTRRNGSVSVIVSPGSLDQQGNLLADDHQRLADSGATFMAVDVAASTIESLKPHFAGFDTVINCMGFIAGAGTQIKITRAVLEAGVRRYFPGSLALITMWSAKEAANPSGTSSMRSEPCCGNSARRSG